MKSSGVPLTAVNSKYHAQITAQLHGKKPSMAAIPAGKIEDILAGVVPGQPRLRQSSKGPNKTEAAFAAYLRAKFPAAEYLEQAVTLVLANGLRYTPDLFHPGKYLDSRGKPVFYEVKGFMRDDAAAKIKMAARVHAWADFYLVTKIKKGGGWQIEKVLP